MAKGKELILNQSALFKKGSQRQLAEVLFISPRVLRHLRKDSNYQIKKILDKSGKERELQIPMGALRTVHDRMHRLLSDLATPAYLYSGKKGKSTLHNALSHVGGQYGLKIDIKKFFPSCSKEAVFLFFRHSLEMPRDIADLLAEVCTYKGSIPTGSPLSMSLAFWAFKRTFDRIHDEAEKSGNVFSLYVDDMNFSSLEEVPIKFEMQVNSDLKRVGLRINRKKTERSAPGAIREITGVGLGQEQKLVVPFKRIKRILDVIGSSDGTVEHLTLADTRSVLGMIQSGRQIKNNFFKTAAQKLRQHQKSLERVE